MTAAISALEQMAMWAEDSASEAEFTATMKANPHVWYGPMTEEQPTPPGYWMYERSGLLQMAIFRYYSDQPMVPDQIAIMRDYLRQWMAAPWRGSFVEGLRQGIDGLTSKEAIRAWLHRAAEYDIDPL